MPAVFDALASGRVIGSCRCDRPARRQARRRRPDAELRDLEAAIVRSAERSVVEVFEREMPDLERILTRTSGTNRLEHQRQQRNVKRWVDKVTGMCHTHLELDPESDGESGNR